MFKFFGGAKELTGAEEIKEEIIQRGPVVSTSFEPSKVFLKHNSVLCPQKELLIVGWEQQPAGEVWIVAPLNGLVSLAAHVSFGQFGIDDSCVAPINSMEDTPWESGPYFDINMTGVDEKWRTEWSGLSHKTSTMSDLEQLLKVMGKVSVLPFTTSNPVVCIRDKDKKAHSRRGKLKCFEWVETNKQWKIEFDFC